jgi:hypothetical protein
LQGLYKWETIETQVNEVSGNISEKRISTDVFVPSINIPFGLNKLSSSLPLSCIIARLVQVVKVTA